MISFVPWALSGMYTMKRMICQGLQAKLRRRSLQPLLVLMAVMMFPLLFRHPKLYPAMWQEETIASIWPLSGSVS
jgi:hypothetical protein